MQYLEQKWSFSGIFGQKSKLCAHFLLSLRNARKMATFGRKMATFGAKMDIFKHFCQKSKLCAHFVQSLRNARNIYHKSAHFRTFWQNGHFWAKTDHFWSQNDQFRSFLVQNRNLKYNRKAHIFERLGKMATLVQKRPLLEQK